MFSGSVLSIKGPAAGLIAIALGAVHDLGQGDALLGYRLTLAIIVVSGVLQIVLGLVKAGSLADFFPSTVVYGMLAAIGIIIISKQIHVLLGVKVASLTPVDSFALLPNSLLNMNPAVAFIGGISLAILFIKPYFSHPYFRIIPAQLIVLIVAIPLGMLMQLHSGQEYTLLGISYLRDPQVLLVDLPDSFFPSQFLPDFSSITSAVSIKYLVLFTLIGSIESLLTAKAVDSLDPYKRHAQMNNDLVAVGIGNTLAGLLGGLPMISEVARSSNNVQNGARTRWANFFHGLFLFLFVIVAAGLIEMIPNAALAAMLIFTGYNLAAPKEFINTFKIGADQLIIFVVTEVATLEANDL